jgi:phosphate transport system substrate-binding protein
LKALSDFNLFRFHEPYFHDPYPTSEIVFVHLLALFLLLLPLGSFGYFWTKKLINELDFKTYFMIFALAIYALFCLNLAFVLSEWSYANRYFVQIALYSNPFFIAINVTFVDEDLPLYAFLIQIASYAIFSFGIILSLWKKGLLKLTKPMKILASALFILTLALAFAALSQWSFKNSLFIAPSVAELDGVDDSDFHTPITALRGEPTLKFEDDFPRLDGATAFIPIFWLACKAIYPKMQDYSDYIVSSSTPTAYERLIVGGVDLIFTFAPSDEQTQKAKENGVELILTPIGKEAFVFLTNKENPVKNLSVEQIRQIYTGKITNWRKLGGEDEKILAFGRNKNSGSQTAMEKYVMNGLSFKAPLREEFHTMSGLIEGVANYRNAKNAIGYSFRYYSTAMNPNSDISLLSVNGIEPTVQNIKNNTYPFTADFYIVSTQNSSKNAKKLIEWFLSEQGQAFVEDVGYVPIRDLKEK